MANAEPMTVRADVQLSVEDQQLQAWEDRQISLRMKALEHARNVLGDRKAMLAENKTNFEPTVDDLVRVAEWLLGEEYWEPATEAFDDGLQEDSDMEAVSESDAYSINDIRKALRTLRAELDVTPEDMVRATRANWPFSFATVVRGAEFDK